MTSRMVTASASGLSGVGRPGRDLVGAGRLPDDAEDHPADRGELGIVERLGGVLGRVVERVLAGAEEEVGDLAGAERAVVAPVEERAGRSRAGRR